MNILDPLTIPFDRFYSNKRIYQCDVCKQTYENEYAALLCEKQPIHTNANILPKKGDIILFDPKSLHAYIKHTTSVFGIVDSIHYYEDHSVGVILDPEPIPQHILPDRKFTVLRPDDILNPTLYDRYFNFYNILAAENIAKETKIKFGNQYYIYKPIINQMITVNLVSLRKRNMIYRTFDEKFSNFLNQD